MRKIRLRCGIIFHSEDIAKILSASMDETDWQDVKIPQHDDIDDVEQVMIRPVKVAGVTMPVEPIAYGIKTSVVRGEDLGRIQFSVESSVDFLVAGRFDYSFTERKTIVAEDRREMEGIVLSEVKRFFRINL